MSGLDNLNPDVSAFVPKTSPKNEVANAVVPPTAEKHSSEATNPATNNSTEDANIWKEVKRRSKTSQQKEPRPRSTGSDIIETTNITVNNVKNTTAVNSNSNSVASTNPATQVTNASEKSVGTKKSTQNQKEELDFQFDEEIHYDEDMLHSGGRHNNFSELSDDEESDFELSDRDINKLLIVTQVKSRPPKHEGIKLKL